MTTESALSLSCLTEFSSQFFFSQQTIKLSLNNDFLEKSLKSCMPFFSYSIKLAGEHLTMKLVVGIFVFFLFLSFFNSLIERMGRQFYEERVGCASGPEFGAQHLCFFLSQM